MKKLAIVKSEANNCFLEIEGNQIDIKNVGWVSAPVKYFHEYLERDFTPITEKDIQKIIEDKECYLEFEEIRNIDPNWDGNPMNYYSKQDPMYREELLTLDKKFVIHFCGEIE